MITPLIQDLIDNRGIPRVDEASLEALTRKHHHVLLFFTENPLQFPESNDVAVVLPQLMQVFAGRFQAAIVARESERRLHARFPFDAWPALVLLREGRYVGAISRMQAWDVYLSEMARLLDREPQAAAGRRITLVSAGTACH